jgi:predicted exporter
MAVYCGLRLEVGTDLTNFMPDGSRSQLATVATRLTDSPLTRTMALTLRADELETALRAARDVAAALGEHPEIAWARAGAGEDEIEPLYRLYFPRRHLFLADDPEVAIPDLVSEAALRRRARDLRHRLATPASALLQRIAPADPLAAFEGIALRLREGETQLATERGQWVTRDRGFAVVLAGTRSSAFDSGAQSRLLADLARRVEEISARLGTRLDVELAGANRFAVAAEKSIKRDVYLIGACSFLGVAALFVAFVGSVRGFLVVAVPPVAGILVATTLALLAFGELDGLTMVFGASLMGIAIDYSNHLLIHHGLSGQTGAWRTARRLRPSLSLGALTTVASFGGLALTAFPAFREMSFFAGVGVLAALLVSLFVLPDLLGPATRLPGRSRAVARRLGRVPQALERLPRAAILLPIGVGLAALAALPGLRWQDDMARLTSFDPALVEEERRVRERVAGLESSRFVIGLAQDGAAALALNDRIHRRLERPVREGELGGVRSLHGLLWSEELQRRNWSALTADANLYGRLDAAFTAEGFRPGAFRAFGDALAGPAPEPLRLADLEASPLADLLEPFVFALGDELAVVTYLRGVREPEALRAELGDLPGVFLLDQRTFVNDIYREFRETTFRQMGIGAALVLLLLALRYRAWRPVVASFLPAATVAVLMLAGLALLPDPGDRHGRRLRNLPGRQRPQPRCRGGHDAEPAHVVSDHGLRVRGAGPLVPALAARDRRHDGARDRALLSAGPAGARRQRAARRGRRTAWLGSRRCCCSWRCCRAVGRRGGRRSPSARAPCSRPTGSGATSCCACGSACPRVTPRARCGSRSRRRERSWSSSASIRWGRSSSASSSGATRSTWSPCRVRPWRWRR